MFEETKDNKYKVTFHEEISKAVPKMAGLFKTVERAHVEKVEDKAALSALASKIEKGFEEYEKLLDIHVQLGGEKKRLSGCNKRAKIEKIEKI